MRSRVMPGSSPTIDRRVSVSRLNSVDFPTRRDCAAQPCARAPDSASVSSKPSGSQPSSLPTPYVSSARPLPSSPFREEPSFPASAACSPADASCLAVSSQFASLPWSPSPAPWRNLHYRNLRCPTLCFRPEVAANPSLIASAKRLFTLLHSFLLPITRSAQALGSATAKKRRLHSS